MVEGANNSLNIRYHGMTLLQCEDNRVLSHYVDPGETLNFPELTNEQANYVSTELVKRVRSEMAGLLEELAAAKTEINQGAGGSALKPK